MFRKAYLWIRKHLLNIDDRPQLEIALSNGLAIGKDCHVMGECIIDPGHCWLITIGDRVTLAPRVHILAHDASTKRMLGYTLIGRVSIGNDVFIGAGTIVLPNVEIGSRVVIGAGSVVTHSIPSNSVAVDNPAHVICSYDEYLVKRKNQFAHSPVFDETFTIGKIDDKKREEMKEALSENRVGFIK